MRFITRRTYRSKDQLTLNPYKAPSMELKNVETTNIETKAPVVQDSDANYLIVEGCGFRTEFNRENGYLIKYEVNGQDMIKEGEALTPNFWRAPTDNDFGAGLQKKYAAWKNPEMKLTSLNQRMENKQVIVEAAYDMPTVSAKLNLTYVINNKGAIKVTQKMTADKNAKGIPHVPLRYANADAEIIREYRILRPWSRGELYRPQG